MENPENEVSSSFLPPPPFEGTGEGTPRPVALLPPPVARKIAAGEVIDRPRAVVRELLDNAVDSGADEIRLYLEEGGNRLIRVLDNGRGMTPEDLRLCCLSHATSKIRHEDDLNRLSSLGFRGEALSSIAAGARLEIISRPPGREEARKLVIGRKGEPELSPVSAEPGTIVEVGDLFYNIPARRKFLKSPAAEFRRCRQTFLEKASSFPEIEFRLFRAGKLKDFFPKSTAKERILRIHPEFSPETLHQVSRNESDFELRLLAATPFHTRRDRQGIKIYVNRRRIEEYALLQAVQYSYDPYMPGGLFPACHVFIRINPALVDFNIHPAKKEVRFRRPEQVRHGIREALKNFLKKFTLRAARNFDGEIREAPGKNYSAETLFSPSPLKTFSPKNPLSGNSAGFGTAYGGEGTQASPPAVPPAGASRNRLTPNNLTRNNTPEEKEAFRNTARRLSLSKQEQAALSGKSGPSNLRKALPELPFRYLGQFQKLFLLAEYRDKLFIVDQHAAHERIIFDEFSRNPPPGQKLLLPLLLEFETPEENRYWEQHREKFRVMGIETRFRDSLSREITALPKPALRYGETILELIKTGVREQLERELYATMACREAVKAGELLSPETARELLEKTFRLPEARCPHGRPLWIEITPEELEKQIGRTI